MRIVLYSGGVLSWAAAMRTIERHGRDNVRLLFTDTSMEDEDLYRFLDDSERQLGVPLIRLRDGRTPWDVFRDRKMLGNTRIDVCSAELKRKLSQRWLAEHAPGATLVFGIDWEETHRVAPLVERYGRQGYGVECPMTESPWRTKEEVFAWCRSEGLRVPRLYEMGFAHNNCGGFCVRAGHAHFAHLLRAMPDRYRYHEEQEQELRARLGKDVSVLRDRATIRLDKPVIKTREGFDGAQEPVEIWTIDGTRPMTLREFRERIERGDVGQLDMFGIGGCGCFVDAA